MKIFYDYTLNSSSGEGESLPAGNDGEMLIFNSNTNSWEPQAMAVPEDSDYNGTIDEADNANTVNGYTVELNVTTDTVSTFNAQDDFESASN